ncbi:hypothetical protein BAJUN_00580 [Bajunvirus bajun]|uniref:Uncharacterized protein n=1 Tax=Brevundimonas phage vB_BgoS-Bajun TaxID=2948594 RepID=A0A9E7SRJ4_9CAUD|nr:hypothetical protein BAJUN_00580 [Brevundimonas phage vB_BgoS-Bajun]
MAEPHLKQVADALDRLIKYADGAHRYKAWRGKAPQGEPTLVRDMQLVLPYASYALKRG